MSTPYDTQGSTTHQTALPGSGALRSIAGAGVGIVRPALERTGVLRAAEQLALGALDVALKSRLAEQTVDRILTSGLADQVASRVLTGPELERMADQVLESPAAERLIASVIDSRLMDEAVALLLASEDLWTLVDEIARSPAVTDAISHQGLGFADQVAGVVRDRTRTADARLEHVARRLLRRPGRDNGQPPR